MAHPGVDFPNHSGDRYRHQHCSTGHSFGTGVRVQSARPYRLPDWLSWMTHRFAMIGGGLSQCPCQLLLRAVFVSALRRRNELDLNQHVGDRTKRHVEFSSQEYERSRSTATVWLSGGTRQLLPRLAAAVDAHGQSESSQKRHAHASDPWRHDSGFFNQDPDAGKHVRTRHEDKKETLSSFNPLDSSLESRVIHTDHEHPARRVCYALWSGGCFSRVRRVVGPDMHRVSRTVRLHFSVSGRPTVRDTTYTFIKR